MELCPQPSGSGPKTLEDCCSVHDAHAATDFWLRCSTNLTQIVAAKSELDSSSKHRAADAALEDCSCLGRCAIAEAPAMSPGSAAAPSNGIAPARRESFIHMCSVYLYFLCCFEFCYIGG
jgi:hypothetical protein